MICQRVHRHKQPVDELAVIAIYTEAPALWLVAAVISLLERVGVDHR